MYWTEEVLMKGLKFRHFYTRNTQCGTNVTESIYNKVTEAEAK